MPAWTVCGVCGALVGDPGLHDTWHAEQATPPTNTTTEGTP